MMSNSNSSNKKINSSFSLRQPELNDCTTILAYIRQYRSSSRLIHSTNNSNSNITVASKTTTNDESLIVAVVPSPSSQRNNDNVNNYNDDNKNDNDENDAIALLEPHLSTFRSSKYNQKEIPQQLLRFARLFRWKWIPIRKALLRPFDPMEIEVGSQARLSLVKLLHEKGLIATSEVKVLESSLLPRQQQLSSSSSSRQYDDNDTKMTHDRQQQQQSSSRPRKKLRSSSSSPSSDLSIALSYLPNDVSNPSTTLPHALRHISNLLKNNNNPHPLIINADDILSSFAGCILARNSNNGSSGIDDSAEESCSVESFLVKTVGGGDDGIVARRLDELLSPPLVNVLDHVHILTITRWFIHCNRSFVEDCLIKSFRQCCSLTTVGLNGMNSLPKIIAGYALLSSAMTNKGNSDNDGDDVVGTLLTNLAAVIVKMLDDDDDKEKKDIEKGEEEEKEEDDDEITKKRMMTSRRRQRKREFTVLIFRAVRYLLESGG